MSELAGVWNLSGYAFVESDIRGEAPESAADNWLFARGNVGLRKVTARSGLELTIRADGTFTELVISRPLELLWYDSEGIQVESPEGVVSGVIRDIRGGGATLIPNGAASKNHYRYHDGDTIVCDLLRAGEEDEIYRFISVVTDGTQLDRVVARYERASGAAAN